MVSFSDTNCPEASEDFCHEERLEKREALDLARTDTTSLSSSRQCVLTQDRDDIFQFLVALQNGLHATRYVVVLWPTTSGSADDWWNQRG